MKTVTSDYDSAAVMRGFPPPREQRVTLDFAISVSYCRLPRSVARPPRETNWLRD